MCNAVCDGRRTTKAQSPFSPLYLPEFNTHVSWFMCQNPACENFGHHFRPDNSRSVNQRTISDSRYRIDMEKQGFHCGSCQKSCALKSNSSIRTVARYFLSHSFPFADCPDAECANHGRNLFEHRPRSTTGRRRGSNRLPYFIAGKHRVECSACGGKFTVGAPLRLRDRDPGKVARVLEGLFDQRRVSRTLRVKGMSSSSYYSRLRHHAVALRDWQSVQTAQLLAQGICRMAGATAHLHRHSSGFHATRRRWGKASDTQHHRHRHGFESSLFRACRPPGLPAG